ncbi:MAG: hypothetical protein AABW47_04345 [Nanoarchaeota archaeon]
MKIRKIVSKQIEERKRKKGRLIAGIVMVAVMFFSVVGYSFMGRDETSNGENAKIVYNNLEFSKENGLWATTIGDFKFLFKYNPNEVNRTASLLNLLNTYSGKPLYFSANGPEAEIARNLFYQNQIAQRIQYACLEGETCVNVDYPIKTCQDNFFMIRESENTRIEQKQNCIFIEGKKEDLIKLTDSVLFKIIGIQ